MRQRWIWTIGLATLLVGGGAWYLRPRRHVTVHQIEAQLQARTPVGASAEQVLAVLDSMMAEHSDASRGIISANFGKSHESAAVYGAIYGTFTLDSRGRLASYKIEELFTGP